MDKNENPGALAGATGAIGGFPSGNGPKDTTAAIGFAIEPVEISKNSRETLRLAIDQYKGKTLLSCRLWYIDRESGELRPGRDGWAVSVEKLPEGLAGLRQLEAAAITEGLLNG